MVTLLFGIAAALIQSHFTGILPLNRFIIPAVLVLPFSLLSVALIYRFGFPLMGAVKIKYVRELFSGFYPFLHLSLKRQLVSISVAAHLILLVQTAILLDMFGFVNVFDNLLVVAQSYAFMIFLPIFVANAGIREYSFALFMDRSGYSGTALSVTAAALGVAGLILLINIIVPAFLGLIWMFRDGRRKRKMSEQALKNS